MFTILHTALIRKHNQTFTIRNIPEKSLTTASDSVELKIKGPELNRKVAVANDLISKLFIDCIQVAFGNREGLNQGIAQQLKFFSLKTLGRDPKYWESKSKTAELIRAEIPDNPFLKQRALEVLNADIYKLALEQAQEVSPALRKFAAAALLLGSWNREQLKQARYAVALALLDTEPQQALSVLLHKRPAEKLASLQAESAIEFFIKEHHQY